MTLWSHSAGSRLAFQSQTGQSMNEFIDIESRYHWERGGYSLYFRDPDGHLIELVTPGCWTIY